VRFYGQGMWQYNSGLYSIAVVSLLVAAGALIAEPLGVAAAVVELILGFLAGLAGVPSGDIIESLAVIGSVFIMYMAGLEIEPAVLRGILAPSLTAGLTSFLAPLAAVFLALNMLGLGSREAVLTAIGVSTTSVAVVYAILRRTGLLRRRMGQAVLSVAMVADIASIIAFVVAGSGHDYSTLLYIIVLGLAPFALSFILDYATGGEAESELRVILAILAAASLLGEYFGVHAILFAFLFGVATRETVARRRIYDKVAALTFGVLAPIFFVDAGIRSVPSNLSDYLEFTLILLAVSLPVKIVATHSAIRLLIGRIDPKISTVFGARLTVSTVIAFAGEESGVLPHDLAGSIILSALLATVASALVAGRATLSEEAVAG